MGDKRMFRKYLSVLDTYLNLFFVATKLPQSNFNPSNVFIKPLLHQPMSQSAVQKPSLKPQAASNAGVEARWLGKTP
jgi:hypothetical protein